MTSTPDIASPELLTPALLSMIVQESADCIKVLDLDAKLLSMNVGGQQTMEIDDFSVCHNLLWPEFWQGEDRLQVEAALERARAGQRSTFEGQAATFKGTPRWWAVRVAPLLDEQGVVRQLLAVSRDVTTRKQAELALVALNADLERQVADQVAARARQLDTAQAQTAFVAFVESVGSETDILALARQASAVLSAHLSGAHVGYYQPQDGLWKARVWSEHLSADLVALVTAGFPAEVPMFAPVLATRDAVFIDAWDDEREGVPSSETYGTVANYPLLVDGEVQGIFSVGLQQTRQWTEAGRALVRAVGRGLQLALDRSAQLQRLEENARAQQAFLAFTEAVGTQSGTLSLAQQALSVLQVHLPDSHASWHTPDGDLWKARAWNPDLPAAVVEQIVAGVPGRHPVIAQMVDTRQPVFLDRWDTFSDQFGPPLERLQSVAAYPLLLGGQVTGMLSVGLNQIRPWRHQDRAVVSAVGRALNLALERADDRQRLAERATELQSLNQELRRERTFLQAVLQSMSEGVVACDEHGQLALFNEATKSFHGLDASLLPPEEWAGHYDLFEGDGVTPMTTERVPLYRAWQEEILREVEMVIRPNQGPARQLLASGGPMLTPEGQPLGAMVTMRDVTGYRAAKQQLHHSYQQLERSNAELRAANEELEAFAYSASHDLRTPVRHVQSFSQLARKAFGDGSPDTALRHLGFVEQAATRMNTLIDAMLQLSRSTRQGLTPGPVALERIVLRPLQ